MMFGKVKLFHKQNLIGFKSYKPNNYVKQLSNGNPFFLKSFSTSNETNREKLLTQLLQKGLNTNQVFVRDVSGGCGASYQIKVFSKEFKGKTKLQQHRMVNELIKEETKDVHSISISTETLD